MGSLHVGVQVDCLVVAKDGIWSTWENSIGVSKLDDLDRFVRSATGGVPQLNEQLEAPVRCMAPRSDGGVWLADDGSLWFAEIEANHLKLPLYHIARSHQCTLEEPAYSLIDDGTGGSWVVTLSGQLYRWDGLQLRRIGVIGRVLAADVSKGELRAIVIEGECLKIVQFQGGEPMEYHDLQVEDREKVSAEHLREAQIVSLDPEGCHEGCQVIIRLDGQLYHWAGPDNWVLRLETGAESVVAVSRAQMFPQSVTENTGILHDSPQSTWFAFTKQAEAGADRPRLELWKFLH